MRFQVFGLEIPRETVFGLEQRNFFLQTARDVAQLHVLTGLNAEQHLGNKVSKRFAETRGEFGGEARELGFQAGTNLARLHGGTPPWQVRIFSQKPSTTDSVPSHFCKTINPYSSNACPHLQRKTQEGPCTVEPQLPHAAPPFLSRNANTCFWLQPSEFHSRRPPFGIDWRSEDRSPSLLPRIALWIPLQPQRKRKCPIVLPLPAKHSPSRTIAPENPTKFPSRTAPSAPWISGRSKWTPPNSA